MQDSERRQSAWESRYASGDTAWDRGEVSPALRHWTSSGYLPTGRVLVPGCGNGHEVAALVRSGRQVTAVDIASQPVARLAGQLAAQGLHADVVQTDLLQWVPAEPFDAIYEQTCLCALEPNLWQQYEQRLADWLLPGGILLALFLQTGQRGGPPYHCPLPVMRELFDLANWDWCKDAPLTIPHPSGFEELGCRLMRR